MSGPQALIAQGRFTSAGTARAIELPQRPDYFEVFNSSLWGTAPTAVVKSCWYYGYANGRATTVTEGGGSALTGTAIAAAGAGFTFVDYSSQNPGALVALTAAGNTITPATSVTLTAAPAPIGSIVRIINPTGMLQIGGTDFTVTAINAGVSMTLAYGIFAAYAANATNGSFRIIPAKYYNPYRRTISFISQAASAVISVTTAHNYLVGDKVIIHNPDANFGMRQINNQMGTITAVTVNTMTVDIDSTAYTAFAYPTSAIAATGVTHPHVTNVGEVATKLTSALDNDAYYAMYLDTGVVGANGNVMYWRAFSSDVLSY